MDSRSDPTPRRYLICAALAAVVVCVFTTVENVALQLYFPTLSRVGHDFSPTYLRRHIDAIAANPNPPKTIFFGDSIMWGYGLRDEQNAVSLLVAGGCACVNMAFNLESPTNEYALIRFMQSEHIRPRAVVLELDQVSFNPASMEYEALRDQVYDVTRPVLEPADRRMFASPRRNLRERFDRMLARFSTLYALRSDGREALVGEPPEPLTDAPFEKLYSLVPLSEGNVAVHYLERTLALLQRARTPVYAFLAPANRQAFGALTDDRRFRANAAYVRRVLAAGGARVMDVDAGFDSEDFLDHVHLSAGGQRKLARLLATRLGPMLDSAVSETASSRAIHPAGAAYRPR